MKSVRIVQVWPVLRYFYALAWRHRKSYFVLVAGNMLLRGCSPFVNIVLPKYIIDELLGQQRVDVVATFAGALIGANFVLYLLNNLRDYLLHQAHLSLDLKFDELLGRKAMEMDFAYTENPQVLTQLEKAKTGMSWYSGGIGGISGNLTSIVAGAITLSGTLYIIGRLSPWLIAALLAIVLLNMLVTSVTQKEHVQFMKDLVGINRKFSYYFGLLKNFRYGKDIRLYNAADLLMRRVDQYIKDDWGIQYKRTLVMNRFTGATTFLNTLQQAVLYGYLGLRVLAGVITIGEFQRLVSAAGSFAGNLQSILRQIIDIGKNADFMNEYKVFMEYPSLEAAGDEKVPPQAGHTLEARDVSFKYPGSDAYALRHVSLTIPAGQKLSIMGPNGAGKTTFIKLLTRLYEPTEGAILLDGKDIRQYSIDEYRKLFAVVFQDYKLLAFSLRENLTVSDNHNDVTVDAANAMAGLRPKVDSLPKGLDTPIYKSFDKEGVEFSGGESQKLAIARAIYKSSPVIVLDEPTAALDPVAEYEVYTHFDRLVGGKTAIYISHRLASCRFCDKIAVFDDGRIVEYGDHAELSGKGGLYAQMWNAQAQWYVSAAM